MELIRDIKLEGTVHTYRLQMWHMTAGSRPWRVMKERVAYLLEDDQGPVFEGFDFYASPMHAVDSDETVRALLGFLTLRPGDTDPDYFENYTERQHQFAEEDAEYLSIFSLDDCSEGFEDWDGGEV